MTDVDFIRAIEERTFNAWPARQTVFDGGWLFRLAGGFTKRANSANALAAGAPFDGIRARAEALYARHGLPAVFRLSPLAPPDADRELAEAGYAHFDVTPVMRAPLTAALRQPSVQIDAAPSNAWLDGFAASNGVKAKDHAIHHAMVHAIAQRAAFATLHDAAGGGRAGEAIGFGLAVCERGAVGFYDIVVAPAQRGRGHGRKLMQALMQWGLDEGAGFGYLQVREQNASARRLYAQLGFEDIYSYHYRVPAHLARA